jgi:RHS repeat-associated protein
LTDFLFVNGSQTTVYLSTGFGFVERPLALSVYPTFAKAADFDGDGITDFLAGTNQLCRLYQNGASVAAPGLPSGSSIPLVDATCNTFTGPTTFVSGSPSTEIVIGDFNGDGRADFTVNAGGGTWDMFLSRGDGTFARKYINSSMDRRGYNVFVGDFNGDGLTDLLSHSSGSSWLVCLAPSDETATDWMSGCALWSGHDGDNRNNLVADFNGDGRSDIAKLVSNGAAVRLSTRTASDVVARITNGLGVETKITYAPLTQGGVYTRDPVAAPYPGGSNVSGPGYPVRQIQAPLYVVSRVDASNGIGGDSTSTYTYKGFKVDLDGKGTLGFRETTVLDAPTGIQVTTTRRQDWPYIGSPSQSDTRKSGAQLKLEALDYDRLGTGSATVPVFPYLRSSTITSREYTSGQVVSVITTINTYAPYGSSTGCSYTANNCGNPTQVVVLTSDGAGTSTWNKTTDSTYVDTVAAVPTNPGLTDWILERLTSAVVTSVAPNTPTLVRRSAFNYYADGLLKQEIVEPNDATLKLVTEYAYDGYGNRRTVSHFSDAAAAAPYSIATRTTTTTTYDADGRCAVTVANALNHTESYAYTSASGDAYETRAHRAWCNPSTLTGPNGLTTTFKYDWTGRKFFEQRADGTTTAAERYLCGDTSGGGACPSGARFYTVTSATGTKPAYVYHDMLGREVRSEGKGFAGRTVRKDTTYNAIGKVASVTRPYFDGDTPQIITSDYDPIGRPWKTTAPGNEVDEITYSGYDTTFRNPLNQTRVERRNAIGKLVSVTDNAGAVIAYAYDAFENLTATTDPAGNVTRLEYDVRGRKTRMIDPNLGTWTYAYDVLGLLRQQVNARGQTTTLTYDLLNRLKTRAEPTFNSAWNYDTCLASNPGGKCVGKLVRADNGAVGWKREVSYDALGRAASVAVTIDTTYVTSTTYDAAGRVETISSPHGYAVRHVYSPFGYLLEVRQNGAAGPVASGALLWRLLQADAQGRARNEVNLAGVTTRTVYAPATDRLQQILVGRNNGVEVQDHTYAFNALGRLDSFTDGQAALNEVYGYDALNRLRTVSRTGSVSGTDSVTYDALGNITSKSGVGTYAYNASGANAVRPHAVAAISGTVHGIANPTFTYDAAGNLTAGLGRSFDYTSFNLPARITQGALVADFTYDADYGRIKQVAGGVTTIYLNPRIDTGGTYTKEVNGSSTTHRWIVYAGGRPVLEMQRVDAGATQTWRPRWYHTNHLGSLVALTDESGAVRERLSYDAWGRRRNLDGTADPNAPPDGLKSTTTPRGFTLHEHLDHLGLVHMNGRLFEPLLGRFLTADPLVADPANLQSHNRYAYVLNSPFMYTDPSGFKPFWKQKWFRTVAAIVAVAVVPQLVTEALASQAASAADAAAWAAGAEGSVVAADAAAAYSATVSAASTAVASYTAAGFVAGGIQGGTIESALQGAVAGGIFSGISSAFDNRWSWGRVAVNSVAGGALSEFSGGSFRDGLRFALASSLVMMGWDYTRIQTDAAKMRACAQPNAVPCVRNKWGELRTDGARDVDYARNPTRSSNWLTKSGMEGEGLGTHWYDPGGPLDNRFLARYINQVSKLHDWFNSWNYNADTGFYMSRGSAFDTFFQLYSFGGMPVAGLITGAAQTAILPYDRLYRQQD